MTRYTRAELEAMSEPHLRQVLLDVAGYPEMKQRWDKRELITQVLALQSYFDPHIDYMQQHAWRVEV